MELYIIDAIGPFFRDYDDEDEVINWSKIPFRCLEKDGKLDSDKFQKIRSDFTAFVKSVSEIGYNSISIDDVAHLVDFDFYPEDLRQKIRDYQREYRDLFKIAQAYNLRIFINTDIMFYNEAIERVTKSEHSRVISLLSEAFEEVLTKFPIDGVILRVGESDGTDVKGDFLSRLTIRTPGQARKYVKSLLPIFERLDKYLIFRTWTLGAYEIGDLIWNKRTYHKVFGNIHSDQLIVSMKYGDTDFFEYLELNPLFFYGEHKKIIELQTRREREGSAVNPYYVGWQYERYFKKLRDVKTLVGISVWCQTGGWSRWRDLTFLKDSSKTNELNTYAALRIFRDGISADSALEFFWENSDMVSFFKKFRDVFLKLLYIEGFSDRSLYFRRIRIPPLLWICWDYVTVTPFMRFAHRFLGGRNSRIPYGMIDEVRELGERLGIENYEFYYRTLRLLAHCREALVGRAHGEALVAETEEYKRKYPGTYQFNVSLREDKKTRTIVKLLLRMSIRERPEYRLIDGIIMNRFFSFLYSIIARIYRKDLPRFVNREAMRIDVLFK